jgi:folate-binding Fe-S cluster repair protein YgfZ
MTYDHFVKLDDYALVTINGADACTFLQGQCTQDIQRLDDFVFKMAARLDRGGRVKSFFYVIKKSSCLEILVEKIQLESLLKELKQFVVSEDVIFEEPIESPYVFYLGNPNQEFIAARGFMYGQEGLLLPGNLMDSKRVEVDSKAKAKLDFFSAQKEKYSACRTNELINNSSLFNDALALQKGCYIGQETVNKIYNGRSAPKVPCFFFLEDFCLSKSFVMEKIYFDGKEVGIVFDQLNDNEKSILLIRLERNFGVEGLKGRFLVGEMELEGKVALLENFKNCNFENKAQELFELAVKTFHQGNTVAAKNLLLRALDFNPKLSSAIETMGVILGREKLFEEAIVWMDRLLSIDPRCLMAHTNKSLFYMNMGKIDLAEEEKAKATLLSFELLGQEAEQKKLTEIKKREEEQTFERKAEMFKKVLVLDPEDEFAYLGLAEIFLIQNKYFEIISLLSKFIYNPKIKSSAYFLYCSALFKVNRKDDAKEVLAIGLEKSKLRGEMQVYAKLQELAKVNE